MRLTFRAVSSIVAAVGLLASCFGGGSPAAAQQKAYAPFVAPASDEGRDAIQQFKVPDGFKVELFAAEPRLANPVAFTVERTTPAAL